MSIPIPKEIAENPKELKKVKKAMERLDKPMDGICPICKGQMWGLEDPDLYDGVSWWGCPKCKKIWDRFTGEEVSKKEQKRLMIDNFFVDI